MPKVKVAFDGTVRMTSTVAIRVGTSLGPPLLAAALTAAELARSAEQSRQRERWAELLQQCLVAVLCAHAAVEAQLNEACEAVDPAWLADMEERRLPTELKWRAFQERRHGAAPNRPATKALSRLSKDRNLVAHFKGIRHPDGTFGVAGPPVRTKGGISGVRAYFDAARAESAVADARLLFESL